MTKQEFEELFRRALEIAAQNAEGKLGREVPRDFQIRLYGAGHSGDLLRPEFVVDKLYLGDNKCYLIIDVAVIEISNNYTTIFMRISQHEPGPFERTWNNPPGSGPFKQLFAKNIKIAQNS
jgi:hypothetical protein